MAQAQNVTEHATQLITEATALFALDRGHCQRLPDALCEAFVNSTNAMNPQCLSLTNMFPSTNGLIPGCRKGKCSIFVYPLERMSSVGLGRDHGKLPAATRRGTRPTSCASRWAPSNIGGDHLRKAATSFSPPEIVFIASRAVLPLPR